PCADTPQRRVPVPAPTPPSTLSPYTTLFRSTKPRPWRLDGPGGATPRSGRRVAAHPSRRAPGRPRCCCPPRAPRRTAVRPRRARSEEHTSELQSRENLVCRLLLEKKKKTEQR